MSGRNSKLLKDFPPISTLSLGDILDQFDARLAALEASLPSLSVTVSGLQVAVAALQKPIPTPAPTPAPAPPAKS
jgi:hypothetical protein